MIFVTCLDDKLLLNRLQLCRLICIFSDWKVLKMGFLLKWPLFFTSNFSFCHNDFKSSRLQRWLRVRLSDSVFTWERVKIEYTVSVTFRKVWQIDMFCNLFVWNEFSLSKWTGWEYIGILQRFCISMECGI